LLVLAGCPASAPTSPKTAPTAPATAGREGRILFDCQPADARVAVDGREVGTAAEISRTGGLGLPQGLHRIEIAREGFRPFRIELNLGDKVETIRVQLRDSRTGQ
jgi:hypothetical protein